MTWIQQHAWWLLGGFGLAAIISWDQVRRVIRQHRADEEEYEHELEQQETLPALPPQDLVGADRDDSPSAATAYFHVLRDEGLASGADGAQDLRPADPGRSAGADLAARLTPAQRRRAIKKGRIPRDLPGRVTNQADLLAEQLASSVGEPSLAGGVAPAPAAGQHHRAGESFRRAEATQFWTQLARDRDTAYQAWADGFRRLEHTNWLELAA